MFSSSSCSLSSSSSPATQISNKYEFTGKVALITGSSSGICEAIALQFAKYGANVVITGRDPKKLSKVGQKIQTLIKNNKRSKSSCSGSSVLQIVGDLQSEEANVSKQLINETIAQFGQLDILVNNAGSGAVNDNYNNANLLAEFDSIFRLNVRSAIELIQLAIPYLEQTKGNIINISSIASVKPVRIY